MSNCNEPVKPTNYGISLERLLHFRTIYGGTRPCLDRMATLIWAEIMILEKHYDIAPIEVLRSIDEEEGLIPATGIKPPTQFKRQPLKGLWHKHYSAGRFLTHNACNDLNERRIQTLKENISKQYDGRDPSEEILLDIAHRLFTGTLDGRSQARRMTGEWIIYVKRSGVNFYLTCRPHSRWPDGDQLIIDEIAHHCVRDFPDVMSWIDEAANSL